MRCQIIIAILTLFLLNSGIQSQPRFQWVNTYGESPRGADFNDVYLSIEGNFALCGRINRDANAHFGWIVLLDGGTREVLFSTEIGEDGDYILFHSLVEVDGGGFLAAGYDHHHNGGDFIATRVSNEGEVLWTEFYGDNFRQHCYAVIELKNGNFLLAGFDREGGGSEVGYLIEIDSEGEVIWEENYREERYQVFSSIRETDDGYLLAGASNHDGWLLKVNEIGEVIWSQTYSRDIVDHEFGEYFSSLISCPGGYLSRWVPSEWMGTVYQL